MPGAIAVERFQAGLEATRGTAVPATRIVYKQRGGWVEGPITNEFLDEDRTSYIAHYASLITELKATVDYGIYCTCADLAWYGQQFWAGSVAGVLSASTVYTYTFSPTIVSASTDNIKTTTFEAYSDTQGYQVPFCLGEKFELTWQAGKAVTAQVGYLGQQLIPQSVTAALTDRTGLNPLAGTTAKVYIDPAGGTIGTTQILNPVGGKITWTNQWEQLTHTIGNLYPDDADRLPRYIDLELDLDFNSATEYANVKTGAERLIRVVFTGPVIAGSTGNVHETATFDFMGYYLQSAFSAPKAIRMVKLTAQSQYDTNTSTDWKVAIANALSSLP